MLACRKRSAPEKESESQTRPCAAIYGRLESGVGKRHQRGPRQALLEPGEPVVDEQGKPNNPKDRRYPAPPPKGGGVTSFWAQKRNSALWTPVCGFESRVGSNTNEATDQPSWSCVSRSCHGATAKRSPRIRSIRLFLRKSTELLCIKNPTNQVGQESTLVQSHRGKFLKEWTPKNEVPNSERHIHKKLRIKS